MVFDEAGTYVETDAVFTHNRTHEWNHGLGEIVTALLDNGMELTGLAEHTASPGRRCPGRWSSLRAANGGWPTGPGGSPTATPCRPSGDADPGSAGYLIRWPISFVL